MVSRILSILLGIGMSLSVFSQDSWDLRRMVEYALANNITIQQTELLARGSELSYKQSKASRIPSLNFQGSTGFRFGRSENPTTGVLEDNNFLNAGMQLQSQVQLFNFNSLKNSIEANRLAWEANMEQVAKVKNDIALMIAVQYLQVLLNREQVNLASAQLRLIGAQLDNTRKRVAAGLLPELNATELEAQLARDSSAYIASQALVSQSLLSLKSILNLDAAAPFEVVTPPVDMIPVEALADLQPEVVYSMATATLPQQKVNELRIQSARKNVLAARGNMYPTVSAFGSMGTNYVNIKFPQYQLGPFAPTGATVNVNGTTYVVEAPDFIIVGEKAIPLGTQFRNNFGQSIGLGLSVPLFNGRIARTNWERAKISVAQEELTRKEGEQQLKQDIYSAYFDAVAALQKYEADRKTVDAARRAFEFAQKRYDLNLLSTFELINSQNNLARAQIQAVYSRYDYIFKIKLLEFYKGQGLKL